MKNLDSEYMDFSVVFSKESRGVRAMCWQSTVRDAFYLDICAPEQNYRETHKLKTLEEAERIAETELIDPGSLFPVDHIDDTPLQEAVY